ncbi:MAG: hypothetical protein ILP04_06395 [Bacteroidales bacterium]|nr:hypothetical protein [Bacteroidales bacterium]
MKKLLLLGWGLLCLTQPAASRSTASVRIEKTDCLQVGDQLLVMLQCDLSRLRLDQDRALFITPYIVGTTDDSLSLPAGETRLLPTIGLYGANRYWYYLRSGLYERQAPELQFRQGRQPDTLFYKQFIPFESWMGGGSLRILMRELSCDDCEEDRQWTFLGPVQKEMTPEPEPLAPLPDPVPYELALTGSARIDFPTDRWDILEDFSDNRRELGRIRASIDTVLAHPDMQLTGIRLTGHASPEAPYEYNRQLSARRVEAIRDYLRIIIMTLDGTTQIAVATVPEDWDSLRRMVENSSLPERTDMLEIIDHTADPDEREELLKKRFPDAYRQMYQEWYPLLRRTDYRINYILKTSRPASETVSGGDSGADSGNVSDAGLDEQ